MKVNETHDRVAMHAVRRTLLEAQAEAVGLPVQIVPIPSPCPNQAYEAAMERALTAARTAGVDAVAFGDLFLEDVLRDLPATVDPCGERGEFRSFAWDGPAFRNPVPVRGGDVVERDGFVFADLLPAGS